MEVGCCDECKKYLYATDNFYIINVKMFIATSVLREDCIEICQINLIINNVEFTNMFDKNRGNIYLCQHLWTMTFTHKYPWTANEKAPAMESYSNIKVISKKP